MLGKAHHIDCGFLLFSVWGNHRPEASLQQRNGLSIIHLLLWAHHQPRVEFKWSPLRAGFEKQHGFCIKVVLCLCEWDEVITKEADIPRWAVMEWQLASLIPSSSFPLLPAPTLCALSPSDWQDQLRGQLAVHSYPRINMTLKLT